MNGDRADEIARVRTRKVLPPRTRRAREGRREFAPIEHETRRSGSSHARRWAGLLTTAMLLFSAPGRAEPQLSTSLQLGVAGVGTRSQLWSDTYLTGGLRAELLFGRDRDASFGVGPYVEGLTTTGFSDIQVGGGAAVLVPIHEYLPLVLSGGAFAGRREGRSWEPGMAAELFWGTHGYNYHSLYSLSAGLIAGGRYSVGESKEVTLLAGGRMDLEFIAIPFILAWGAIRGGNPSR